MTYEEFIEKAKTIGHDELGFPLERMKFYPRGYTSDDEKEQTFIQDSNWRYVGEQSDELLTDFLVMETPEGQGHSTIHRVAIRYMYEDGQKRGFDEALQDIRSVQKELDDSHVDHNRIEQRALGDYEAIREQLIIRPLNYNLHIRDLKGCVYKRISDFALVLYQIIGNTEHNLSTSKIKRSELKKWGVSEERAIQDALENTAKLFPACVYDQRTHKEENLLEKDFEKKDITFHAPHGDQILISTVQTLNGAVALFYPGVQEKLVQIMGGPFQVVFMNINDIMIFDKEDQKAYHFAQTAKESSSMGEMLSGKLYLCDGKSITPGIVVKMYSDGKITTE